MRRATSAILVGMIAVLAACSSGSSHNNTNPPPSPTSSTISPSVIGTVADADWRRAAFGEFQSQRWEIWIARSKNGWLCYTHETRPGATTTTTTPPATGGPAHRGNPATCLAPSTHTPPAAFTALIAGPDVKNQWVVVGAVPDGVKTVSIEFADGSTTRLGIDQRTHLVEWKGPASLRPARVHTDRQTCGLDRSQLKHGEQMCAGVTS